MHPVLGTMMPEICEAPHLPVFPFIYHCAPYLMGWDVFITFPLFIANTNLWINPIKRMLAFKRPTHFMRGFTLQLDHRLFGKPGGVVRT